MNSKEEWNRYGEREKSRNLEIDKLLKTGNELLDEGEGLSTVLVSIKKIIQKRQADFNNIFKNNFGK